MRLAEHKWLSDVALALGVYCVTALLVALGLALALTPGVLVHAGGPASFPYCFVYHDGGYYWKIMETGYWVREDAQSPVAFFPGLAVAGLGVVWLTGLPPIYALEVVSNVSFVAALALTSALIRTRWPEQPAGLRVATLAMIALYPAGLYFRFAYSESLFLAVTALLLLGLARRWPLGVLALVAGASTGVRAVGVAGAGAVMAYVLFDAARGSLGRRALTAALVAPLTCWGLLAFMAYQHARFGNAFAFADAQKHWAHYVLPDGDKTAKWVGLATGEPLWNAYNPDSARYWANIDRHGVPGLGQAFWNPIVFVLAVAAVGFGWWRGWLNVPEAALGFGLLLIPYASRGYEMSMASQARFVSVALPSFLVLGHVLSRSPHAVTWVASALMAAMLTVWTMMFVTTAWALF